MKLLIGEPSYDFRHVGDIRGAFLPGQKGKDMPLTLVPMETMKRLHDELPHMRAIPTHVAFDRQHQKLWVHPRPKGEFVLEVERAPGVPEKDWGKINDPVKQPVKVAGEHTLTLPKKG